MTPTELASLEALAKAAPAAWSCEFFTAEGGYIAPKWQEQLWRNDPRLLYGDTLVRNVVPLFAANPAAILSLIEENKRMREARKTAYDALLDVTDVRDRTKDGSPEREIAQAAVMAAHKVYFAGEAVDPNYAPDAALEPQS